jgi:trk system potassium uptake protein TrkH
LVVKDTGADFTLMGQMVILALIQLGGLGIVVFGVVFSLLLGQALSLRESVAVQDLLSTNTLNRIGNMIGFIFTFTLVVEVLGTFGLMSLWRSDPQWTGTVQDQWFYSLFHAISAFCNAGFGLYGDSLERFDGRWEVYGVIAPLIILGGMGFSVLYNLCNVIVDRIKRTLAWICSSQARLMMRPPKPVSLQSKIVVSVSVFLILAGTVLLYTLDRWSDGGRAGSCASWPAAFFQSISARTAGFNTIAIHEMTGSGQLVLMVLMFLGGSPGSTAGGIKTVTLAVIVMAIVTTLRKRGEVEMFHRSVGTAVVGRAVTVTGLFVGVLLLATFLLSITERGHTADVTLDAILFETTSALGTVGLTTGITPNLTALGKCIIIFVMLIGRLGPLTLLAALTFDIKAARYSYPAEPVMVG